MNIGIDFDNTIAHYDTLFREVAIKEGIIDGNWDDKGKTELRDHLRRQPNGEKSWMKLQGLVYGKYMLGAKMMSGVANFFLSCNVRGHKIFIVSHKTEYGHFDPEKISLRREAIKWMKAKYFFDAQYFGINKENVFFADTREEKVKKIELLNCDWFIDDLPEVFEETKFPSYTKKILFGSYEPEHFHKTTILNSWRKISEKILGETTDKEITAWSKQMVDEPIKHIEKITGRGNSSIYKVMASNKKSYALKYYPDQISDKRTRLKTEFGTLRLLHQENLTNVPKAVEKDDELNLGLYEWINGDNFREPSVNNLNQVIDFVGQLYLLSKKIDGSNVAKASEACLSANELVNQVENRLLRLKQESKRFQELSKFLGQTFEPLWAVAKDESIPIWPLESRYKALPKYKQTLSPSDLGFHNCLKGNDGSLTFIDFDYFGWDDPVKLTADFIWHPAMNLNIEIIKKWQEAMLMLFSHDNQFESRLRAAMPIYGLRWAMIVLNEFLPGYANRRKEAGKTQTYNLDKSREIQLKKAKHYCEIVKTMTPQVTYA
jgi:thiamine kinase-like enzyme